MDPIVTVALIIGAVIVLGILVWAALAVFAFRNVRKAQKEMFSDFDNRFSSHFNRANRP